MRALLALFLLTAAASPAWAAPQPAAKAAEKQTLEQFARAHPTCREWSDGCAVCTQRDEEIPLCSLPGIACQPAAIACEKSAAPSPETAPK